MKRKNEIYRKNVNVESIKEKNEQNMQSEK